MEIIHTAPVACAIFAITIITSLLAFSNDNLYGRMMLHPYTVSRGKDIHTIITSGLIHRDWMHLFFNMLSFYFFAFTLEPIIGHLQFGILYVLSLILSDMPTVIKHKNDYNYYSLGASGAVSAVIFSIVLFMPWQTIYIMPIPIGIWFWLFGILYLVYCHYASKYSRDQINHDAHFFGAISGLIITIVFNHHVLGDFIQQIISEAPAHFRL
ncbi:MULTISPECIES: rhomboid family intramembrane serine protease [Mucilaginibacter]|uniref:Rhomboid family intramembrane serine protease n=1 Tax=Mucilaginibacter rubeus TaxID=2027860 RepID=A0A5C1I7N4_9SPHI|nr:MULTISPECIES: rhomboid family intramembrane serine protease [Mucilaginibacter]QEM13864.1 rhomboid family intramembrane serine protease [Mucilaginibacter rubeus]